MNNWKLRSTITGKDGMDLVEVNGHISSLDSGEDCLVQVQPHGETYPYFLRTSASEDLGPVPNQVPGHLQQHLHPYRGRIGNRVRDSD